MNKSRLSFYGTLLCVLLFNSCAQMVPLSGGEKDTEAPKLISSTPPNLSVSYSGSELQLDFDEYIQVKDIQNQLLVTPRLKELPDIQVAGKKLLVKIKEPLQANATYNFNFGNAISDVHEGNTAAGLQIIFSTGNNLDSLQISGQITDAYTTKPCSDCSVFIYENGNDSCLYKSKPDYYTKADKSGFYKAEYIKKGTYRVFAISDKNKNLNFDGGEELIAPLYSPNGLLQLEKNETVNFSVYQQEPEQLFLKRTIHPFYGKVLFVFNKQTNGLHIEPDISNKDRAVAKWNRTGDTLSVFYKKGLEDSIFIQVYDRGKQLRFGFMTQAEEKFERDKKNHRNLPALQSLKFTDDGHVLGLITDQPIKSLNKNEILMISDKDTVRIKIKTGTQSNELLLQDVFNKSGKRALLLPKGSITAFGETDNDTLHYKFEIKEKEELGSVELNLELPDKGNYLLEWTNEKGNVVGKPDVLSSENESNAIIKIKKQRLEPGNYFLRLIKDDNKDEKWNAGHALSRTAPEKIYYYGKAIKIIADWEITTDWKAENAK